RPVVIRLVPDTFSEPTLKVPPVSDSEAVATDEEPLIAPATCERPLLPTVSGAATVTVPVYPGATETPATENGTSTVAGCVLVESKTATLALPGTVFVLQLCGSLQRQFPAASVQKTFVAA